MWIWIANKFAKFHAKRLKRSEEIPKSFRGLLFWNTLYSFIILTWHWLTSAAQLYFIKRTSASARRLPAVRGGEGPLELGLCATRTAACLWTSTFRRSLYTSNYSTQRIETMSSKSNFNLLWSWPCNLLTPRSTRPPMLLPRGPLIAICIEIVHSLSKYSVHKLVTDGRTDRRTDITRASVRPV